MPRDTDVERESRTAAIGHAARGAAEVPYRTIEACIETVRLAEALAGRSNRNASSDLEVSALLAVAAAESAAANVRINLQAIGDDAAARDLAQGTEALIKEIQQLAARARAAVASGEPREPLESVRR
jgi:formiminotetrahydrofolate cyclodeaminase